jgi:uncharacterized protein (DUF302 family)
MVRHAAGALALALLWIGSARAEAPIAISTPFRFDDLVSRVESAAKANGLVLVGEASASRAAAARGIAIPGNAVIEVFNNDYAVRMLAASTAAGIEAPLRLYLTENKDGTATLFYRRPSALFAPYHVPALDRMAKELDGLLAKLAADATTR